MAEHSTTLRKRMRLRALSFAPAAMVLAMLLTALLLGPAVPQARAASPERPRGFPAPPLASPPLAQALAQPPYPVTITGRVLFGRTPVPNAAGYPNFEGVV